MSNVRVGLLGACGRMGNLIIRRVLATEGMELSAAFDIINIGKDIGEVQLSIGSPFKNSKVPACSRSAPEAREKFIWGSMSTASTENPLCPRQAAVASAVVVLPTPPFLFVIAIIFIMYSLHIMSL